jgi:hypothetical protein
VSERLPLFPTSKALVTAVRKHVMYTPDGHAVWTGRRSGANPHGTPIIRIGRFDYPAAAVVLAMRSERVPVGRVRSDCDRFQCVHPRHVSDKVERDATRVSLRWLSGRPPAPAFCKRNHPSALHGAYKTDGSHYCQRCHRDQVRLLTATRLGVDNQ